MSTLAEPETNQCPEDWALTEETQAKAEIKAWENVLARKTFRLTNPADTNQVLYCYTQKRRAGEGSKWHRLYGNSAQASITLLNAWIPRDGWIDDTGKFENFVATLARIFKTANMKRKMEKEN